MQSLLKIKSPEGHHKNKIVCKAQPKEDIRGYKNEEGVLD